MIGARKLTVFAKNPRAPRSSDRAPPPGKRAGIKKLALTDLPLDVLRVVAAQVRGLHDCCDYDCCHRVEDDDGDDVDLPYLPIYSVAARSLAALRRTCSAWFQVVNETLQCHVQLALKTEVAKINGVRSLRVSLAPLRDDVVWAPPGLAVMEPRPAASSATSGSKTGSAPTPTPSRRRTTAPRKPVPGADDPSAAATATNVRVVDKLKAAGAAVVLVPDFGKRGERGRRIPIPTKLVTSVSLIEPESAYILQNGRTVGDDLPADNSAFATLLDRIFKRFPRLAKLSFGKVMVPAPTLDRPLLAVRNTLTSIRFTALIPWPVTTPPLTLPHLRDMTLLFLEQRDPRDKEGLKTLPIRAPNLQTLYLGSIKIHAQFFRNYLGNHRATLKSITIEGNIEPTAKDMAHMAADASAEWSELEDLDVPLTALFLMVAGTQHNAMPELDQLTLRPCRFRGTETAVPLPALPKLRYLCLFAFLQLQPTLLRDIAAAATHLKVLKLTKCKLTLTKSPITVPFPDLDTLVLDRTVLHKSLAATIQAPAVTMLQIDAEDPADARDYPLPATLTDLILSHSASHDSVHLRASALDALPHLSTLQLFTHVAWVGGTAPVLPHVTRFVAVVDIVNEIAQVKQALPKLIDLEVARACESCADALRFLPDRPLERLEAHVLHPVVFAQIMTMESLKTLSTTTVRLAKADKGVPLDRLELVYDQRRMPWVVLPQVVPRDALLAKKFVIKVVHAPDVVAAMEDIDDGIHALVVGPTQARLGRMSSAVPVEVVVGEKVPKGAAGAFAMVMRPFELGGFVRGGVYVEP
ncbi:hypothetical protein GGF31_007061 [Allomyces arbusculus]|nr:hypothetical protein GGF31_007061 [Allomyces arbusculus]